MRYTQWTGCDGHPMPFGMAAVGPGEFWLVGGAEWDSADDQPYQVGYFPTATPLILGYHNGHWTAAQ